MTNESPRLDELPALITEKRIKGVMRLVQEYASAKEHVNLISPRQASVEKEAKYRDDVLAEIERSVRLVATHAAPESVPEASRAVRAEPDLLSDELLEVGRSAIEDALVEFRDERIQEPMRNNGCVIKERDGTRSDIIRFGPETALRIGIKAMLATHQPQAAESVPAVRAAVDGVYQDPSRGPCCVTCGQMIAGTL